MRSDTEADAPDVPSRYRVPPLARPVIAAMRAVPLLFTSGWLVAAVIWAAGGQVGRALSAVAVGLVAASFGVRIALWSR